MRAVIKQDFKITTEESEELQRRLTDLYYENAGITPEFYIEQTDFSSYPTYIDSDGDIRPTNSYLKGITDEVHSRYGEFGTDHIVVLVHEDNWKSDTDTTKGIWGTSYSNLWGRSYHLQYVRFDRDNEANQLGTLYHEIMHSHDALIKTTIGVDIDKITAFAPDWDRQVVHGGGVNYSYMRYMDNLDALQYIAPYLRESYAKRKSLHVEENKTLYAIIALIQKFLIKYKAVYNRKDGVPR